MQAGLVDEFGLWVHPVVRQTGKRLCDTGREHTSSQRVEAKPFSSGVVLLRYQAAPKSIGFRLTD